MSITFDIRGYPWPLDTDGAPGPPAHAFVNLANENATAFFTWLALPAESALYGSLRSRDLRFLLTRKLASHDVTGDEGTATIVDGNAVCCSRPVGRFRSYAERLLALCDLAGDLSLITWD